MAKKVVATLQKGGGKEHTKVIKMIKSEKLVLILSRKKLFTMIKSKNGSIRTNF